MITSGVGTPAQQLDVADPKGKGSSGGAIVPLKRTGFRLPLHVYLFSFGEVLCDRSSIRPIRAVYPNCFFLLIALAVLVLFSVGNGEIDDVPSVHGVNGTIFSKVADDLHFDHSAQFLDDVS